MLALAAALALASVGCAPRGTDLVGSGAVALELATSREVELLWVSARQRGDELVVSGRVRARDVSFYPIWGHVWATVVGPDGEVLARHRSGAVALERPRNPGRGQDFGDFTARLPVVVPRGSVVRLAFGGASPPQRAGARDGGI